LFARSHTSSSLPSSSLHLLFFFQRPGSPRVLHSFPTRRSSDLVLDGSAATAGKFRKYLLVRTQMSVLTGLFVGLFALATGLQFRSEEHTSELQSLTNLVCRLLLEKKK